MKKLVFVLLTILVLASCSASRSAYRNAPAPEYAKQSRGENQYGSTDKALVQEKEKQERIVIYNAFITMVVQNPDSSNSRLTEIANKYDGYVQTLGSRTSIIRVKSDKLHSAVADISKLGKVKSKTISGKDVTTQYTDYQIRLENARNARKRYLELLEKAENVEAALKVEKELERLNGEIDALEGTLNNFRHLSDYSTITIYLDEKVKPGILGYIGIGIYKSVKWLIVRN